MMEVEQFEHHGPVCHSEHCSIVTYCAETLTFDAFEDVPSMMEVEMFDYEGPFAEADLLGRAEVHLLKQSKEGLSDIWLPLEGRKAGLHGSRLHIRVQLSAQGGAAVPKIMEEISKETGRKVRGRVLYCMLACTHVHVHMYTHSLYAAVPKIMEEIS